MVATGRSISTTRTANKPVTAGRQTVRIEHIEWRTSQNGNDYLAPRLKVLGGPDDGKTLFDIWMVEGTMRVKLENTLEALEIPEDQSIDPQMLVGGEIDVLVKHEEYNDEIRARVEQVYKSQDQADEEATTSRVGRGRKPKASEDLPF